MTTFGDTPGTISPRRQLFGPWRLNSATKLPLAPEVASTAIALTLSSEAQLETAAPFPNRAIRLLTKYARSNAGLAELSNVSKEWRNQVAEGLIEQAQSVGENEDAGDSYCIAWFPCEGLKTIDVSLREEHARDASPEPFCPSGGMSYGNDDDNEKSSSHQRRRRSRSPTSLAVAAARLKMTQEQNKGKENASCVYQWNGFQEAMEVLEPFGYEKEFVETVLSKAKTIFGSDDPNNELSNARTNKFAVRGATFARPKEYCLCWDDLAIPNTDVRSDIHQMERQREWTRKIRRRSELHREVLPQLKNRADSNEAVQFLNADSTHAVRMLTPPFDAGPISTPITLMYVAIATEDGCFVSGLHTRFECGHLYPQTPAETLLERTPICLCYNGKANKSNLATQKASSSDLNGVRTGSATEVDEYDDDGDDSSSCGPSMDPKNTQSGGIQCTCPYQHVIEDDSIFDDEEFEDNEELVRCRGRLGPGLWHCYTMIFDGDSSSIRIDGATEPVEFEGNVRPKHQEDVYLDGLTLGSDHCFDMSLCFGLGSDEEPSPGEGVGAIAEVTAFHGITDEDDLCILEKKLMTKYGIPRRSDSSVYDDECMRRAHGQISNEPYNRLFNSSAQSTPLRFYARHPGVAWSLTDKVTGDVMKVPRIGGGVSMSGESSDW